MQYKIDLNADVGEGIGNEAQLMPYISSCNIACGGHAGTDDSMQTIVKLAKRDRVKIGAHPSFPDKKNFGRLKMDISSVTLFSSVKNQIESLVNILREEQAGLHHIKPHGALYNLATVDKKIALVIIEVIKSFALPVKLFVPYDSVIANLAIQNNIPIIYEAFADRNYNDDLTLVSRAQKEAIIQDSEVVFKHVFRMISEQKVKTISGKEIEIMAQTFCVHGDNPKAINLVKKLNEKLKNNGVEII